MPHQKIVQALELQPHPEGGFYRETFRDIRETGGRSQSTAIYFLLPRDETSRWHRVDSAEVFHFYAGAPLELRMLVPSVNGEQELVRVLGTNLSAGEQPQLVVPAGYWQSARSLGEYSLVGCTVSPGFEFSHFEIRGA